MSTTDSASLWMDAAGRYPLLTAAEELQLGRLIQAWQQHPDGPEKAPAKIKRRGLRARDRMVTANLRLVVSIVSSRRRSIPTEDALQAGAMGLQRAAERFDPSRGYKFSTYAYWWIRQSINREQIATGRTIRIPASYDWVPAKVNYATYQLAAELGRTPTTAEIAERIGLSESELRLFLQRTRPVDSLDWRCKDGDGLTLGEMIAAPDDGAEEAADNADAIAVAMRRLNAEQRKVIEMHYLKNFKLKEIVAEMGITKEQVRRLGRQGLDRLRWSMAADQPESQPPIVGAQASGHQLTLGLPVSPVAAPAPVPAATCGRGSSSGTGQHPGALPALGDPCL